MNTKDLYSKYVELMQRIADIRYASAVLGWDEEVNMPAGSAKFRARQSATLTGIAHSMFTSKDTGQLLLQLSDSNLTDEIEKQNVAENLKDFTREKKFTREFVEEQSRLTSESYHAWMEARKKLDFRIFAPALEKIVDLKLRQAEILGYKAHPYDSLLDLYEPGLTVEQLDKLFTNVRAHLVPFIRQISEQAQVRNDFMFRNFEEEKQWNFGIGLLQQMHYDFNRGRQDKSEHPFTTSFSMDDVRVTTRMSSDNLYSMIWSTIHEGGHALYEQGLSQDQYGLPCGEAVSLGIHESQSRLWENVVGRSQGYWNFNFKSLAGLFPESLNRITAADFYKAINLVEASPVRTEADELTYHLHVMIRYEIEKELLAKKIAAKDLREVWNSKYEEYLGIIPENDKVGVLQDVHWSHASFGYFPTYSLGSFYAVQFFEKAKQEIPGLETEIENGELKSLLNWLRKNIHQHGRQFSPDELCRRVTGESLNYEFFRKYAEKKFSSIYELNLVVG